MINTARNFKTYSSEKLTEVGFCPSVKDQVDAFISAGKVLEGAQNRLYHFKDDSEIDFNVEPDQLYGDKIERIERGRKLLNEFVQGDKEKTLLEKKISDFKKVDDEFKKLKDKKSSNDLKSE